MRLSDRKQHNADMPARFSEKSNVVYVREGSTSLKTTVPASIAKLLNLKKGDRLLWEGDIEGGQVFVTVGKVES